jgi:PAS domain S-box-containing protein
LAAAGAVVVLGLLDLLGWATGAPALISMHPGWATMKPNTAVGFVLAATASILSTVRPASRICSGIAMMCSVFVMVLSLLSLSEYAFGIDLGIDQLLFVDPATTAAPRGRMSAATAAGLAMAGVSIVLGRSTWEGAHIAAQALAVLTMLSAYIAILGYAYDLAALYSVPPYNLVALNTVISFLLLAVAIVTKEPERGVMRLIASRHAGGRTARFMLPFALVVPPLLGWLRLEGQRLGLYAGEFGTALLVVTHVVVFAAVILSIVRPLDDADRVRKQEIEFRGLLESGPDAIVIVDSRGDILLINDQTERLFGYRREELLGQPVEILMPDRFRAQHRLHRARYLGMPRVRPMGSAMELYARRRDASEFPVEVSLGPLATEEGLLVSAAVRDITARKLIEAELESNRAKMISSARLSALGTMAGGIAHEINNPLAVVHALASDLVELAEAGDVPRDDVAQEGRRIVEFADRIAKIVKSLRHLSREGERDPLHETPVAEIVARVLDLCQERFSVNAIELRANPIDPRLRIVCREVQISQVLLNLLQNAFDAVEKLPAPKWVRLDVAAEGETVSFSVIDSESGIPPELKARIMEPFYTTKPVGKGTGLGLSLSKKIAEQHGGTLGVTESDGHTCFRLRVPALQHEAVS